MSTAIAPQLNEEARHRLHVIAGMKTQTFKELFCGEFDNLRRAITLRDKEEIQATIEALEACAVDVCRKYDALWESHHDC